MNPFFFKTFLIFSDYLFSVSSVHCYLLQDFSSLVSAPDISKTLIETGRNEKCGTIWQNSFSNLSVTSPTSQLILQPFHRFTYITAHCTTLPLFHLRHSSFSNLSFASPTSQALHLIHLASRPCERVKFLI